MQHVNEPMTKPRRAWRLGKRGKKAQNLDIQVHRTSKLAGVWVCTQ